MSPIIKEQRRKIRDVIFMSSEVKMAKHKINKLLYGCIAFFALLVFQVFAGKVGNFTAGLFSYEQFDVYDIYARVSVHHFVQMIIALAVIAVFSKLLNVDFNFSLGNRKTGIKYLEVFTVVFILVACIIHTLMYINKQLPTYDFPLNINNIAGTLGFQLLLSGTSEEILFRALPVTVLTYVFGKSVKFKKYITLEVILASILFSIAHIKWSLAPFTFEADYFQLVYAFVLGTVQGVAYQECKSILYPVLMHSFSNVIMVGTGYVFALL